MSRRSISDRATAPAPASAWPRPTAQSGLYEGVIATTRQSTGQNLAPADDNTITKPDVSASATAPEPGVSDPETETAPGLLYPETAPASSSSSAWPRPTISSTASGISTGAIARTRLDTGQYLEFSDDETLSEDEVRKHYELLSRIEALENNLEKLKLQVAAVDIAIASLQEKMEPISLSSIFSIFKFWKSKDQKEKKRINL